MAVVYAFHSEKSGSRKSILELAPLECECMNALWLLGEATVRDIREALAPTLPRAYTTIMTIMDRLAQKGAVARRKKGRAYVYAPNLSAEEARSRAVAQLVESYFGGSRAALVSHLGGSRIAMVPRATVATEANAPATDERIDETLL